MTAIFKRFRALALTASIALAATAATAQDTSDLALKLAAGDAFHSTMVVKSNVTQTADGVEQAFTSKMTQEYDLLVDSVSPEGHYNIIFRTTRVRMEQTGMGMTNTMDTQTLDESDPGSVIFQLLTESDFKVALDSAGKVHSVDGLDDFRTKFMERMNVPAELADQMKGSIEGVVSDDTIRQVMAQSFAKLPATPAKVGESWSDETSMSLGFPLTISTKNTLSEANAETMVVASTYTISAPEGGAPNEVNGVIMSHTAEGTGEGKSTYDSKTGMLRSSEGTQDVKGLMKISFPGNESMNREMPFSAKTVTSITMERKASK